MRIVGGVLRGRKIEFPRNVDARPTTDYAKEGLFNILQHRVPLEDIKVLDLFAGTGNVSVEFLSRGARQVVSVEQEKTLHAYHQRLAAELDLKGWQPLRDDVFRFLNNAVAFGGGYDIIFADPPFNLPGTERIPDLVRERNLLAPDGLLIIEHPKDVSLKHDPWYERTRDYGTVHFSFLTPPSNP